MVKEYIKIDNLTKYYGKVMGIENMSFSLNEGEVFGFIGPNGAGKSTTIRSMLNMINKTSGEVYIDGKAFHKDDVELKRIIGYLPSEVHLYDDLSVKDMLDYHESFYKEDIHSRRVELVKLFELDESKMIEDLSLGNLKKIGIILAFMHNPKIIIMDEPTSGLDPVMQQKLFELILTEKEKGTTMIYSTHILSELSKICDRVGIVRQGHLQAIETMENLKNMAFKYVTVTLSDYEKMIKELDIEPISIEASTVKFKSTMEINELVSKLSKYKLDNLVIEDATLEDIFMHYYQS